MPSVVLSGVSFAWDARPVLSDVHLHLTPGWTGVVGANGAGKSTLLGLIDGSLRPESGAVRVEGKVVRAAQRDDRAEVLEFAADWGRDAVRWRARLGLDPDDVERWDVLSPGTRRRWVVGSALASGADVLLLDEPTNHLDAETRTRVVEAMRAWRGLGVVVSHDRGLLDAVTRRTVRVHHGRIEVHEAPFTAAREQWELAARRRHEALEAAQDARRAAERRLADARRQHASAEASTSRSARIKGPRDSDARSIGAATLASWAERRAGRQVEVVRREVDRLGERVAGMGIERTYGRDVFVGYVRSPKARVAAFTGTLEAGGRALAEVDARLSRDAHVRLAGPNGVGKTTLLRALLGLAPDDVLFLPQVLSPEEALADVERVRALPPDERGRVLQHVASLGVDPAQILATSRPSPGEARKLRLALGLGRHVAALFLDEPTNDLDLPAIERLEATLAAWPGALLLVTHDDRFAAACTIETWTLANGRLAAAVTRSP